MCGIFSVLNNNYSNEKINYCFHKGSKRGPEKSEINYFNDGKIIFGFHRLAINGYKDPNANQPFNINNISLICNGEIYNWKELYSLMCIIGKSN